MIKYEHINLKKNKFLPLIIVFCSFVASAQEPVDYDIFYKINRQ